ncbi:capsular polysaccharide transport system permease protein [Paraburkholderia bryophila]|uniref:Capsular polysaccharide transport system permease protein n=1 Tax=Paraburkholderia bryophila TaxID=420952 RepID=A0A7Y9WV95_9BURK|nr:capsular polysaccharide transport system permease protein [Paraburkholderia bryophila]
MEELFSLDKTLETVSSNNEALPPSGKKKGLVERIKGVNRIFALTVVVPTTIAIVYFGLIASDVYVSESRFVVRTAQRQSQVSVVGALLQGSGFSRAQDDTYPVIDYIQSRDALKELNQNNFIRDEYSEHGDFVSRFRRTFDDSFESLWRYYGKHIVSADLDSTSAITTLQVRAFSADDAAKINQALLAMSERLINRMNDRGAIDTVRFAQRQVDSAAAKAKDAAAALAMYRNSYAVFDPERQSALQLQQVSTLQTQLFAAQTQLTQLQSIAPQNPQIPTLRTTISSLQQQIKEATSGVTGGNNSLSGKAANYARLQLDAQFADKQLASAMAALEGAQANAERKQLYLERLVQPNTPDVATEPKRLKSILEVFALGTIIWGVLSLLLAGMREHHD